MKILVTGSTPNHVGKPHTLHYASTPSLIVEGLIAAGHEIDWRPVVPGDELLQEEIRSRHRVLFLA